MYELAVCELMHPSIHGNCTGQSGHYLLFWFISPDEFLSNEHQTTLDSMKNYYWNRTESPPHPSVRNYWNMMAKKRFYTLNVVDEAELCTGVKTAILKTFWLRIFQRKWRNIYKDKQLARRKMKDLSYRRVHGKWPV